ncbi:DVU0298 family protein [Fundidesulfovibrio terrae]|uniref:DVU0298 family protein n=1 Tax=Fundidesulfovibrio terrae TaxID=2922866 RepID=UPI001FAFB630|nr:DVU0298 family protein [Fundidesulfovibrio terrae]
MGKLRELRKNVLDALRKDPWPDGLASLEEHAPKALLGPLFACLLEPAPLVRWRAASAFGAVVSRLFDTKPEDARQLMRQFMWRLNEESGNVAWGVPEAFGEILAAQPVLAREFHLVLASYIHERDCKTGDNYLELCPLRRGVYWGLGRLAEARPELALAALNDLVLALAGDDPESRGLAAWGVGGLLPLAGDGRGAALAGLEALTGDESPLEFYSHGSLTRRSVADMAREALAKAS